MSLPLSCLLFSSALLGCGDQSSPPPDASKEPAIPSLLTNAASSSVSPNQLKASKLVDELISSDETTRPNVEQQLHDLGPEATPQLLAKLIQEQRCQPNILAFLQKSVGYVLQRGTIPFEAMVMPADERAKLPQYSQFVVPDLKLDAVIESCRSPNAPIRIGALRLLSQLGYLGEARLQVADLASELAERDLDPAVRTEAYKLRQQQAELALAMMSRTRLPYWDPVIEASSDWLARLGAEPVRLSIQRPVAQIMNHVRFTVFDQIQRNLDVEIAQIDAQQKALKSIEDAVIERRERRQDRRYALGDTRRIIDPISSALQAERILSHREPPVLDAPPKDPFKEMRAASLENAVQMQLAILILRQARNRHIVERAIASGVDNRPVPKHEEVSDAVAQATALDLAKKLLDQKNFAGAKFWATEAHACFRDADIQPSPGFFESTFVLADSTAEQHDPAKATEILESGLDQLATYSMWQTLSNQGADPQAIRNRIHLKASEYLRTMDNNDSAKWHEAEAARPKFKYGAAGARRNANLANAKADALYEKGKYAEAIDLYTLARSRCDPPDDESLVLSTAIHFRLSNCLRESNRPAEALELAKRAAALASLQLARDNPNFARYLIILGAAYRDLNQLPLAETNLLQAKHLVDDHKPYDHIDGTSADHHLGVLRAKQGRTREAKGLLEYAFKLRSEKYGADHRLTLQTKKELERISTAK